ncbi:hypothetical protein OAD57_05670 [Porticoccaceae bacterium]|nr:hypothetical protein [Porticoccaceae bacterium]
MTDNETIDDTSGQLSLLKRLAHGFLRVILWLIVIAAVIGALVYLYYMYQEHKELTYMTSDECSKHDSLTQICETDEGQLYLRRVDIDNKRMSVSSIMDNAEWDSFRYSYRAFWFESCEQGVEIETNKLFSDGLSWVLTCETKPNSFLIESASSRLELALSNDEAMNFTLDSQGFSINHDYSRTDYSTILRRNALTNTDIKKLRKLRQTKEIERQQARLKKQESDKLARLKNIKLEKLALKKSCAKENTQSKNNLVKAERNFLLSNDNVLRFYCENFIKNKHPFREDTCKQWKYLVTNPTNLEVESLILRYGEICGHIPKNETIINTSIPSGKTITGTVSLESMNGCAKITAIKFKPSKAPIKNCM